MQYVKERFVSRVSVYLFLVQKDSVLLALRKNTGFADGLYSLISGHLEDGETLTEAMIREAKEEANIIVESRSLNIVHVMQRRSDSDAHYLDFYFRCEDFTGAPKNCELDKCDHIKFFPIDNLPVNLADNVRCALDQIRRGFLLSEL